LLFITLWQGIFSITILFLKVGVLFYIMSTSTESKLKIRSTSQELFRKAINTFPISFKYFEIEINTQGISRSLKYDEENLFEP